MKVFKVISPILVIVMAFSFLAGCGSSADTKKETTAAATTQAAATTTAAKAADEKWVVSKPVKMSIIDVAGNAQLSKPAIDKFKAEKTNIVSDVEIVKLTAPELAAKIQAQQAAQNMDTTMILTGYDGLASCTSAGVLEKLWPTYKDKFPNLEENYLDGAKKAFDVAAGYGITHVFCPGGPMFTYNPDKVKTVPKTADELLAWAKENPGKFMYARPANSGPGRGFLQGLPYILGDSDPKDPTKWDKTWAYLKELDKYIDYYPTGTGATFKELGEGTRWMLASHFGWDMNTRILGTIPPTYQAFFLDNTTLITDAQFMCIPKGLDEDRKNASLALIDWLLTPEMQAVTYDSGYFYPGPAIKDVPLSMAPKDSQDKVTAAMRPEYDKAISEFPNTTQLPAATLVEAYDMWDKLVGAKIQK